MLRLVLCLGLYALVVADPLRYISVADSGWENFKQTHHKVYENESVELKRKLIYEDNVAFIRQHNIEADLGKHTYWLGVNQFADWSNAEFGERMNGYKKSNKRPPAGSTFMPPSNAAELPKTVDWRTKGYVTQVKNQGACGSCWAFSTTGSLEGQHYRRTGKLVSLSEQDLVDCATPEGNQGCNGGEMGWAFDYIKENHGIDTEKCYPYEGVDDKCHFNRGCVGATVTGYVNVTSGDEKALQQAVASVGPISVAIDASSIWFQFYKFGVFTSSFCSTKALDHGVLVVGYGTEKGWIWGQTDYWLVKNSWGSWWGQSGYIKMARNQKNMCGIATDASYPLV